MSSLPEREGHPGGPGLVFSVDREDPVRIFADGHSLGEAPLTVTLDPGVYGLRFISSRYYYEPFSLTLTGEETRTLRLSGREAYPVTLVGLETLYDERGEQEKIILGLRDGVERKVLRFTSERETVEYFPGEPIMLERGAWTFTSEGYRELEGWEIPFEVFSEPVVLDLRNQDVTGELFIRGLKGNTRIIVDNEKFEYGGDNPLELPLGVRHVYLWKPGLDPVGYDITVMADDSAFITQTHRIGHGRKALFWSLATVGLFSYGNYIFEQYPVHEGDPQDQYTRHNEGGYYILTGLATALPAILNWILYGGDLLEYAGERRGGE